ncbi:cytochrome P450 family protein [Lentzea sp. CA-135723]|uniref:cytochrome P450 family protein n=1 Tax=Lentzea sp. CA-135723 TaxID=3239950 RepID=UPI003D90E4EC
MPSPNILVTGLCGYRHHDAERELRQLGVVHVAQIPDGPRVQVVTTGLEQSKRLLTDPRLSKDSTRLTRVITEQLAAQGRAARLSGMYGPTMMNADPPQHTRLRALVSKAFNAAGVNRLRPRIEQLTGELLDTLPTGTEVDLIATFAFVLPITIVCELLGVPVRDRGLLHSWTSAMVLDDPDKTMPASAAISGYLAQLIEAKRRSPDEGLCSRLVHASLDEDALTDDELTAMLLLLIVSGHETTSGLIGNVVYALLADPARWQQVVDDPSLVRAAIEETCRYDPSTRNSTHRVTTEPIEVGGTIIPADEIVLVSLRAAGRDPAANDRPDEFDLHRTSRQHLGFGHGIHNCLGSRLATAVTEAAVTQLTRRFPATRLLDPQPPRVASALVGGVAELRLELA